jgi:hypothetical protein
MNDLRRIHVSVCPFAHRQLNRCTTAYVSTMGMLHAWAITVESRVTLDPRNLSYILILAMGNHSHALLGYLLALLS